MLGRRPGHRASEDSTIRRPGTQSNYVPSYYSTSPPRGNTEKSVSSLGSFAPLSQTYRVPARGSRLRRFWGRTLALILGPLAIAGYFIFIWQYFLTIDGPVKFATFNESWIFYSWFVVGVFGLSMSRYGIIGIEAAMLQDPFWQANSAMSLLMHSGSSWGGAGGWMRCLLGTLRFKKNMAGRLWYTLSLVTMSLFVGLPISGLSFELADGYVQSSEPATVIGRTWSNFHSRELDQAENRSAELWSTGSSVSLPGMGLAYTPSYINRDQFSFLKTVPNSLPVDKGVPELFLAPQADGPIGGEAWGLRLSYNCSVVESKSDFTILDVANTNADRGYSGMSIFNSSESLRLGLVSRNLWAYGEIRSDKGNASTWPGTPGADGSSVTDTEDGYESGLLEYALWQVRLAPSDSSNLRIAIGQNNLTSLGKDVVDFDSSLNPSIPDLGSPWSRNSDGTYEVNESFFTRPVDEHLDGNGKPRMVIPDAADISAANLYLDEVAPPIGVRCRHMSILGTARLDPKTTSFSGFRPVPPSFNSSQIASRTPMFGASPRKFLRKKYFELFTSTNSPTPEGIGAAAFYKSYVTPQMLSQAVLRAYAQDALQLMYDGLPDVNGAYQNANLTSSRKGKVLELGIVPPLIPAIWLSVWAFVCTLLGLAYGFRRRWSAALDGYSLFRLGADFADELRDLTSTGDFEDCERLWDLPGFVGDARKGESVGYISLVLRDGVADTKKLYL